MNDEASGGTRAERARPIMAGFAAVLPVLLIYSNTLDAPFLWDDLELTEAPAVRELRAPWHYLTVSFWGNEEQLMPPTFYRPVVTFSMALDRALHGTNAVGFHLTNVLLHLVNIGLAYALALRKGALPASAASAVALWALLPRLTESVAWISGRTDMLCMVFALLAWMVYRPRDVGRILAASGLAFLALLSKEAGVAVVIAIGLSEVLNDSLRRSLPRLVPLALMTLTYALLRSLALGGSEMVSISLSPSERLLTILESLGRYLYMIVNPWSPNSQMGVIKVPDLKFVGLGAAALLGASSWGVWSWRRGELGRINSPDVVFGLAIAVVPLALVIHVIPLPWVAVVGDRLLYMPLGAVAVLLAPWLNRWLFRRRVATAATLALALSLALKTRSTADLYTNTSEFWVKAVEATPLENWGPSFALASELFRAGLFERSIDVIESIERRDDPTGVQRSINETHIAALTSLGRHQEAMQVLETSRTSQSRLQEAQLLRARLFLNQGQLSDAFSVARAVQSSYPNYGEVNDFIAHLNRVVQDIESLGEAPAGFERQVRNARVLTNLGQGQKASKAWIAILRHPDASAALLEEGLANLISFASHEDMVQGAQAYVDRGGQSAILLRAYEERNRKARDLERLFPRIERALGLRAVTGT